MADKDDDTTEEEETESSEEETEESSSEEADTSDDDDSEDEGSDDGDTQEDDPEKEFFEPAPAPADHEHEHEGHDDHDNPMGHALPVKMLGGVLGLLLVLTVVTVAVTYVDLGVLNLAVALLIATVKAGLVVTVFMHLKWDKVLNTFAFVSSVLFAILFVSLAMTDRSEYQKDIDSYIEDNPPAEPAAPAPAAASAAAPAAPAPSAH